MGKGTLTEKQLEAIIVRSGVAPSKRAEIGRWIARGDGVAVYRRGSHHEFISFGESRWAQIKFFVPPDTLPSKSGGDGFDLVGYYRIG